MVMQGCRRCCRCGRRRRDVMQVVLVLMVRMMQIVMVMVLMMMAAAVVKRRMGAVLRWWSVLGSEFHALLFLSLVAEPHANDVLLQVQLLGDGGDLLAGRARLHGEVGLERAFLGRCDGSPFS